MSSTTPTPPFNVSRDLHHEQWKLSVKGDVNKPLSLGWRDLLNRDNFDQVSTLMCIDTLPGGDSLGQCDVARHFAQKTSAGMQSR